MITGTDVYGLTAVTIVEGRCCAGRSGLRPSGALAPSEAFDPAGFLASLAEFGVNCEVEPLPQSAAAPR